MSDDSIFREVDEAVRQDQLKSLWDKYGLIAVSAAFAIVAGVGGYKGYGYWTQKQSEEAGSRFVGGLTHIEDGKSSEASEVFKSLADEGPSGYRLLSRFQLAAIQVDAGKLDEAVKIYQSLATESEAGTVLQDYARLQAAALRVDTAPYKDLLGEIEDLAKPGNDWRHSARETLGLSAYREGDLKVAERFFNLMLSDQQTPANMRSRAQMMLSLMVRSGGDGTNESK